MVPPQHLITGMCTRPWHPCPPMRSGTLRELPKDALRRADALVLHNVDLLGGFPSLTMDRC